MLKSSLATAPEKVKSLTYKLEMRSIVMVKHAVMLDAVQAGAACYTVNMGETCSVRKKEAKGRHRVFFSNWSQDEKLSGFTKFYPSRKIHPIII